MKLAGIALSRLREEDGKEQAGIVLSLPLSEQLLQRLPELVLSRYRSARQAREEFVTYEAGKEIPLLGLCSILTGSNEDAVRSMFFEVLGHYQLLEAYDALILKREAAERQPRIAPSSNNGAEPLRIQVSESANRVIGPTSAGGRALHRLIGWLENLVT